MPHLADAERDPKNAEGMRKAERAGREGKAVTWRKVSSLSTPIDVGLYLCCEAEVSH